MRTNQTVQVLFATALNGLWAMPTLHLYCKNAEQRRQYICSSLYLSVAMAQQLNYPQLAAALEHTFRETVTKQLPETLTSRGRNSTYVQ